MISSKSFARFWFSSVAANRPLIGLKDLNKNVLRAEKQYAAFVGEVMEQTKMIQKNIEQKSMKYNFDRLIDLQMGSAQQQGQRTLTFNRQVLAGLANPELIGKGLLSKDAEARIRYYQQQIGGEWSVGIQTDGEGLRFVRESVISYIQARDQGYQPESIDNICLSEGVLKGISKMLQHFIKNYKDGILIPIPKYPFYSAATTLNGGSECHYYLNESKDWQITLADLQQTYDQYIQKGIKPKVMIVCNPSNPTGALLSKEAIQDVIQFGYNNKVIIFADEVYQENVYTDKKKFYSFKYVRDGMKKPYNQTELISFNSAACGFQGEGGMKGGYFQMSGIDPEVLDKMHVVRQQSIGSNTIGQLCVDLMCNPPKKELVAGSTYELYQAEKEAIYQKQKKNCEIITETLNKMVNISSNEIQGSIYAFPRVNFTRQIMQEAKKNGQSPDIYYALKMLRETGIAVVPGTYFGDTAPNYHFRLSTVIHPESKMQEFIDKLTRFNEKFHKGGYIH